MQRPWVPAVMVSIASVRAEGCMTCSITKPELGLSLRLLIQLLCRRCCAYTHVSLDTCAHPDQQPA